MAPVKESRVTRMPIVIEHSLQDADNAFVNLDGREMVEVVQVILLSLTLK